MDDGRPLSVSISERKGTLLMEFSKAGDGLWAQSTSAICKVESGLETTFTREQIRLGPAANLMLRLAIGNGGRFTFDPLRICATANCHTRLEGRFLVKGAVRHFNGC